MKIGSTFIFVLFFICSLRNYSQGYSKGIFKGVGVYGALTDSRHTYRNPDAGKRQFTAIDYAGNPNYYNTADYISKERQSWGAGAFVELSKSEKVRWQTELAYTNKGSKEKNLDNPFTQARSGFQTNRYTYFQWNNYMKVFNPLGYLSNWYYMIGARLEYKFRSSTPANSEFAGAYKTIWASGDVGLGFEFPFIKKINWFTELHWNPDIYNLRVHGSVYRSRTFELRIGLVYRPKKKSIDDCNAPKYRGPAY